MNQHQFEKTLSHLSTSAFTMLITLSLLIGCANPIQPTSPTAATASALPSISVSTDPTSGNNTVTMTSSEAATIHYTLDGKQPNASSLQYSGPIHLVAGTVIVQAVAQAPLKGLSAVVKTSVSTQPVAASISSAAIKATTVAKVDIKAIGSSLYDPNAGSLELASDEAIALDPTNTSMSWAQYPAGNAIILEKADGSMYYEFQNQAHASTISRAVDAAQLGQTAFSMSAISVKSFLNGKSQSDFELNYQVSANPATEVYEGPLGDICTNMADRSKKTHFLLSTATALVPCGGVPSTLSTGVLNKTVSMLFLKNHLPEGISANDISDTTPARLVVNKVVPQSVRYVPSTLTEKTVDTLAKVAAFYDKVFTPGTADIANYEVKLLISPELDSLTSVDGITGPDANGEWTYDRGAKTGSLKLVVTTSDPAYRVLWKGVYYPTGSVVTISSEDLDCAVALSLDVVPYVKNLAYPTLKKTHKVIVKHSVTTAPPATPSMLAAPSLSPEPGMYNAPVTVTVVRNSEAAQVWYTRNGDTPSKASATEWTKGTSIRIDTGTILKSYQTQIGWTDSPVTSGVYRIFRIKSAPTTGSLGDSLSVVIADASPSSTTTLVLRTSGTEKARWTAQADAQGIALFTIKTQSAWTAGSYNLIAIDGLKAFETVASGLSLANPPPLVPATVATPAFSVLPGPFAEDFSLRLTCTTPGAVIAYTLDGREPNLNVGAVYTAPLTISATTTVKAVAYISTVVSSVNSQTYIRTPSAPVVTISNPTATGATMTWVGVPGATKYRVFVSTSAIFSGMTTSMETGLTSYTYTSGTANTTYHVVISAQGAGLEVLSSDQTFTTTAPSVPLFQFKNANTQEPIASGTNLSLGALKVGESIIPEFTISNAGSARLKLIGTQAVTVSGPNAAEFSLVSSPPLEIGTSSFIRFGIRLLAQSTGSKIATVTILTNDPTVPNFNLTLTASVGVGSPTTLTASSDRYIGVYLEWSEVTGATDFEIERSSNINFTNSTKIRTGFSYNYCDQAVTTPTTYYYRVRAISGNDTGAWSPVARGYRQPTLSSTPSTAMVGTVVTQTGSGYTPNQEVLLYAIGPDNQLAGGKPISVKANTTGEIWTQFTVQASKLKGTWLLYSKDVATGGSSFSTSYVIQ